jgi:hypothetical protein
MYSLAIKILVNSIETLGEKIVLVSKRKRVDKSKRAPNYLELYREPQRYKGRFFL